MSRKSARDVAFKIVFGYLFNKELNFDTFVKETVESELSEEDLSFVKKIYNGVVDQYPQLSETISSNLKDYKLERIYKVDLAILLVAVYELKNTPETTASIVANEAVELAKKYSTEKSPAFINGILATIIKDIK